MLWTFLREGRLRRSLSRILLRLESEQNFSHLSALKYPSGYDLRGLRLRGRGQRGSQLLRDCVPREHRGRQ